MADGINQCEIFLSLECWASRHSWRDGSRSIATVTTRPLNSTEPRSETILAGRSKRGEKSSIGIKTPRITSISRLRVTRPHRLRRPPTAIGILDSRRRMLSRVIRHRPTEARMRRRRQLTRDNRHRAPDNLGPRDLRSIPASRNTMASLSIPRRASRIRVSPCRPRDKWRRIRVNRPNIRRSHNRRFRVVSRRRHV